jgi:hypothetical protein
MSTPASALKSVSQHNVVIVTGDQRAAFEAALRQGIQVRAYELFERQGGIPGRDQAHWLQAESQLLQRAAPVSESGSWSTANVSLPNADPHDVQVLVLDDHAIVASGKPPAYLLIRWHCHVDPATAAAYLKGNTLVVTAKHLAAIGKSSAAASFATSGSAGPASASAERSGKT